MIKYTNLDEKMSVGALRDVGKKLAKRRPAIRKVVGAKKVTATLHGSGSISAWRKAKGVARPAVSKTAPKVGKVIKKAASTPAKKGLLTRAGERLGKTRAGKALARRKETKQALTRFKAKQVPGTTVSAGKAKVRSGASKLRKMRSGRVPQAASEAPRRIPGKGTQFKHKVGAGGKMSSQRVKGVSAHAGELAGRAKKFAGKHKGKIAAGVAGAAAVGAGAYALRKMRQARQDKQQRTGR
jgi:hypothetical protein